MKKSFKIGLLICGLLLLGWGIYAVCCRPSQRLTILHVNDTHSQLEPVRSGVCAGLGGALERAAYIDSVRVADGASNVLVLHAGVHIRLVGKLTRQCVLHRVWHTVDHCHLSELGGEPHLSWQQIVD